MIDLPFDAGDEAEVGAVAVLDVLVELQELRGLFEAHDARLPQQLRTVAASGRRRRRLLRRFISAFIRFIRSLPPRQQASAVGVLLLRLLRVHARILIESRLRSHCFDLINC